jgi:hypothetical protein
MKRLILGTAILHFVACLYLLSCFTLYELRALGYPKAHAIMLILMLNISPLVIGADWICHKAKTW